LLGQTALHKDYRNHPTEGKLTVEAEADGAVELKRSSRVKKANPKYGGANWL
jgi:hypothetical protein